MDAATTLLVAATLTSSLACGATLDQTFKQLPARHRLGANAYVSYVRAADLANGLIWYPVMGITATVMSVVAVLSGLLDHPSSMRLAALVMVAAGTVVFVAATARAAPTLLTLRRGEVTDAVATRTLDRFARFNTVRAAGIAVAAISSLLAAVAR